MPNTTNAIDGHTSELKTKLRVHNGMSLKQKQKFINEFLKAQQLCAMERKRGRALFVPTPVPSL